MNELSIANVEFLKVEISKSGLTYSHLLDDMIDHVCCHVETEMQNGLPFEKAYEMVKRQIGIDGFERIQQDTLYLIDKNYRTMKKTMKIFGVISPILLAFGALFKIEHWPTAGILLVLGFFLLSFFFLPSALYVSYKEISNETKKWTHIIGFLGSFFLSISFLFKIQHWPGTGILLVLGAFLICLVFLPSVLINQLRKKESKAPKYIFVLALLGLIIYILGFTFKVQHWPGATILLSAGTILLIFIALPIYVYKLYKTETHVATSFIFIIIAIVWFVLPTMLISLNVSKYIFGETYASIDNMNVDISFLKDNNNVLVKKIGDNAKAKEINEKAEELISVLQSAKADMVKTTENTDETKSVTLNNELNIYNLTNIDACGSYNNILFNKDKKAILIKEKFRDFQKLLQSIKANGVYSKIVDETLTFDLNFDDTNMQLISALDKLTFLQLNILQAEHAALIYLVRKDIIAIHETKYNH